MKCTYPSVIGETSDNKLQKLLDKISFIDFEKPTNVAELKEQIKQQAI